MKAKWSAEREIWVLNVVAVREARSRFRLLAALCAAMLACALACALPPAAAAADGPWHAEPATYGVSQPVQQMVTMSDGVQLAVDVYRPTLAERRRTPPGRFPVILSQTPYGKRSVVTTESMGQGMGGDGYYPYLVERGYIDVVADVRGSGSSGGDFSLLDRASNRTASSSPPGQRSSPGQPAGSGSPAPRTSG